jgi:glutamate 5-kinase
MASLSAAKRIVIKIGSALLVDPTTGALRSDWLKSLAADVAVFKARGCDVVLVSSGSIALGRKVLGLSAGDVALEQSQAAAAVGQIQLARAYEEVLGPHGITTAQILVTLEDSADRRRYLNSRATLETLLSLDVVPIVNENDTVATDEIRYGDNDRLAAQVAVTVGADQMVLLSDVDGFYSANPQRDPSARRFKIVKEITPQIEEMAGEGTSGLSKGGMKTKLMAAKTATGSGCAMLIAAGSVDHPLTSFDAAKSGTWFAPQMDPQSARKRWIASMKPLGQIVIDEGAKKALESGKSLLPAGVSGVSGSFQRGDCVAITLANGAALALGISSYSSIEAVALIGLKTSEIEAVLGYPARAALVHRNDMAV